MEFDWKYFRAGIARLAGIAVLVLAVWLISNMSTGSMTSECRTAGPLEQYEIGCDYDPAVEDAYRHSQQQP